MKAVDILNHFISRADWVDQENTVDRIIIGKPEKEIYQVMVTWMSSFHAVKMAVERKIDMLITHEPTFWGHTDLERIQETETGRLKKQFIEESGLIVMRIHDVWDRFPAIGIPWAWAKFLNLGLKPAVVSPNRFQHRYDIDPITVDALAQRIVKKTGTLGEPFVQVVGDCSQQVSKVGIGTGCVCDITTFQEMGCDVSIVCDDSAASRYWSGLQYAIDSRHPFIRVNHGTSEEPGMETLTKYINDNFEKIKAEYFPHGCCFRLVGIK